MFSNNGKISCHQLKALIFSDFAGIYIVYLPLVLFSGATEGVFLSYMLSFLIGAGAIWLFSYIIDKKGSITKKNLFFKILCILFFVKTAVMGGYFINLSALIASGVFVRGTSKIAAILILVLCALFLCQKGFESRARFGEIAAFFILLGGIYVFIITSFDCDFRELKRTFLLNFQTINISKGILFSFMGIENLIFLLPLVSPSKTKKTGAEGAKSFLFLGLFTGALSALALCRYGANEVGVKLWPVLQMMNSADFPGMLLERQDIVIMGMWLMSIVSFCCYSLSFMTIEINEVLGRKSKKSIWISAFVIIAFSFLGGETAGTLEKIWTGSILNPIAAVLAFIYILL